MDKKQMLKAAFSTVAFAAGATRAFIGGKTSKLLTDGHVQQNLLYVAGPDSPISEHMAYKSGQRDDLTAEQIALRGRLDLMSAIHKALRGPLRSFAAAYADLAPLVIHPEYREYYEHCMANVHRTNGEERETWCDTLERLYYDSIEHQLVSFRDVYVRRDLELDGMGEATFEAPHLLFKVVPGIVEYRPSQEGLGDVVFYGVRRRHAVPVPDILVRDPKTMKKNVPLASLFARAQNTNNWSWNLPASVPCIFD